MVNNPGYHFPFRAPPLVVWAPHCLGLTYQFRLSSSRFGLFFRNLRTEPVAEETAAES